MLNFSNLDIDDDPFSDLPPTGITKHRPCELSAGANLGGLSFVKVYAPKAEQM